MNAFAKSKKTEQLAQLYYFFLNHTAFYAKHHLTKKNNLSHTKDSKIFEKGDIREIGLQL